jgi:hypothetical protein
MLKEKGSEVLNFAGMCIHGKRDLAICLNCLFSHQNPTSGKLYCQFLPPGHSANNDTQPVVQDDFFCAQGGWWVSKEEMEK